MSQRVIIDGNNLMHAMHAHAPIPHVGRESMFRVVDRWAHASGASALIIYDGPPPAAGVARQMNSNRVESRFSGPRTADDDIIDFLRHVQNPDRLRVVTSDHAVRHAARRLRCGHVEAVDFIAELFPPSPDARPEQPPPQPSTEKPHTVSKDDAQRWIETFGLQDIDLTDDVSGLDQYDDMIDEGLDIDGESL